MSRLERFLAILFLISCSAFVVLAVLKEGPVLRSHYWLFANSVEKTLTPLALLTLITFAYLTYFYKHRAEQAELALEQVNAALESSHELVDRLLNRDQLTDTLNRAGIEKFIGQDIGRAQRIGLPVVALIADCDGFRQINERYGRGVGDIILSEIAVRLKRCARRLDRLGRIDSDQFLLLLNETTLDEAQATAERILLAVSQQPILVGSRALSVSINLGMSILPAHISSLEELLSLTKPSLEKSKSTFRNRISRSS